jgi:type IV secretory pathway VirJ component
MSGTTLKALFTVLATLAAWSVWAQQPADTKVDDLPLVEVPAPNSNTETLCVIVSGDGGWAAIDKGISAALAKQGIPVVGLNALKYFWSARTPDQSAKDLERILRHYLAAWKKQKVLLVGYSFGADVIPFMATRLPDDLRKQVALVAVLSASPNATFQFHFSDWLPGPTAKSEYPTKPEIEKLKGPKVLCICGAEDTDCVCADLAPEAAHVIRLTGAHHFDRDYDVLAKMILDELKPHAEGV